MSAEADQGHRVNSLYKPSQWKIQKCIVKDEDNLEEFVSKRGPSSKHLSGVNQKMRTAISGDESGDDEEVEELLLKGAEINTRTVDGLTALHQSVMDSKPEMVRFLCEKGANVNTQDNEGWTPLHMSAYCGNVSIVRYLCQHGADHCLVNNDNELALDLADDEQCREYLEDVYKRQMIDLEACREQELHTMLKDVKMWMNYLLELADTVNSQNKRKSPGGTPASVLQEKSPPQQLHHEDHVSSTERKRDLQHKDKHSGYDYNHSTPPSKHSSGISPASSVSSLAPNTSINKSSTSTEESSEDQTPISWKNRRVPLSSSEYDYNHSTPPSKHSSGISPASSVSSLAPNTSINKSSTFTEESSAEEDHSLSSWKNRRVPLSSRYSFFSNALILKGGGGLPLAMILDRPLLSIDNKRGNVDTR
ncbi:hypothetical protein CAEBREN_12795 [Caenorhabditis brenneri]|uniref:Uncharacterized protein n=1 Tax=Caenorhabditis brenneri TaxID=135651 RepID=G0NWG8_CAEBE|nr:hypothetical protein CAEBREN_12795 [Caenorhabditis brenneri]